MAIRQILKVQAGFMTRHLWPFNVIRVLVNNQQLITRIKAFHSLTDWLNTNFPIAQKVMNFKFCKDVSNRFRAFGFCLLTLKYH